MGWGKGIAARGPRIRIGPSRSKEGLGGAGLRERSQPIEARPRAGRMSGGPSPGAQATGAGNPFKSNTVKIKGKAEAADASSVGD